MIKRIKRMWDLSRKDEKALKMLEGLTPEQLNEIPNAGNSKAVFFDEGTQEDYVDQERKDQGMLGWYERLKNL